MNKVDALKACEQKINGLKASANPAVINTRLDDRSPAPTITKAQFEGELARLEAARADILTWAD